MGWLWLIVFTSWPNDVKIAAVAVTVLVIAGVSFVASRQPEEVKHEFVMSAVASPYDLNGDMLVTDADAVVYAEMFNLLNFNADAQIDIFDQTMLAGEIVKVYKVYLPVIFQ